MFDKFANIVDATGLTIDVIILAYESGKLPMNLDLLEVKTKKEINIIGKSTGILSIAAEGGKILVDHSDPVPQMKVGRGLLIIEFACPEATV
nr:hypothetical protein [Saprospiraceae bacterium]